MWREQAQRMPPGGSFALRHQPRAESVAVGHHPFQPYQAGDKPSPPLVNAAGSLTAGHVFDGSNHPQAWPARHAQPAARTLVTDDGLLRSYVGEASHNGSAVAWPQAYHAASVWRGHEEAAAPPPTSHRQRLEELLRTSSVPLSTAAPSFPPPPCIDPPPPPRHDMKNHHHINNFNFAGLVAIAEQARAPGPQGFPAAAALLTHQHDGPPLGYHPNLHPLPSHPPEYISRSSSTASSSLPGGGMALHQQQQHFLTAASSRDEPQAIHHGPVGGGAASTSLPSPDPSTTSQPFHHHHHPPRHQVPPSGVDVSHLQARLASSEALTLLLQERLSAMVELEQRRTQEQRTYDGLTQIEGLTAQLSDAHDLLAERDRTVAELKLQLSGAEGRVAAFQNIAAPSNAPQQRRARERQQRRTDENDASVLLGQLLSRATYLRNVLLCTRRMNATERGAKQDEDALVTTLSVGGEQSPIDLSEVDGLRHALQSLAGGNHDTQAEVELRLETVFRASQEDGGGDETGPRLVCALSQIAALLAQCEAYAARTISDTLLPAVLSSAGNEIKPARLARRRVPSPSDSASSSASPCTKGERGKKAPERIRRHAHPPANLFEDNEMQSSIAAEDDDDDGASQMIASAPTDGRWARYFSQPVATTPPPPFFQPSSSSPLTHAAGTRRHDISNEREQTAPAAASRVAGRAVPTTGGSTHPVAVSADKENRDDLDPRIVDRSPQSTRGQRPSATPVDAPNSSTAAATGGIRFGKSSAPTQTSRHGVAPPVRTARGGGTDCRQQ